MQLTCLTSLARIPSDSRTQIDLFYFFFHVHSFSACLTEMTACIRPCTSAIQNCYVVKSTRKMFLFHSLIVYIRASIQAYTFLLIALDGATLFSIQLLAGFMIASVQTETCSNVCEAYHRHTHKCS